MRTWIRNLLIRINRVWALGGNTYIRLFPNPGFGICFGKRRVAVSWRGGFEMFDRGPNWRRTRAYLSRVKRPGGLV